MEKIFNNAVRILKVKNGTVRYHLNSLYDVDDEELSFNYYSFLDNIAGQIGIDFGISPILNDSTRSKNMYIPYIDYKPSNLFGLDSYRHEFGEYSSLAKAVGKLTREWCYALCRLPEMDVRERLNLPLSDEIMRQYCFGSARKIVIK